MQAQSIIFPTFNEKSMLKEEKSYLRKQVDLKSSLRSLASQSFLFKVS